MPRFRLLRHVDLSSITAPVLTKTSAAGYNPMSWSGAYTLLQVDDVLRLSYTKNGGAATTETHTVTSDDLIGASEGAYSVSWSGFVTASASFVATDVITVQERVERSGAHSNYSNILTDTITGGSPSLALTGSVAYDTTNAATHTFTAIPFGAGVPIVAVDSYNLSGVVTITPSGGGTTITLTQAVNVDNRTAIFYHTANIAAGNYDVVVSHSGATVRCALFYGTGLNITPAPTGTATRAFGFSGGDTITSSSLTIPSGGFGVALGEDDPVSGLTWGANCTELAEQATAGSVVSSFAKVNSTGTIALTGAGAGEGCICAAAWGA